MRNKDPNTENNACSQDWCSIRQMRRAPGVHGVELLGGGRGGLGGSLHTIFEVL